MARLVPNVDLETQIKEFLVEQGTVGISHRDLTQRFKHVTEFKVINLFLHELRDQRKVDKYLISAAKGRPAIWWRATTEILNDD
jgi:hypothetical protein